MAARVTWLLLWPLIAAIAFLDFLIWALTCGDDGAADYGEEWAVEFCRRIEDLHDELALLGLAPLAILIVGVFAFLRPSWLRWINLAAFIAAGLVLIGISVAAHAFSLGLVALVAWGVAVPLALMKMLGKIR